MTVSRFVAARRSLPAVFGKPMVSHALSSRITAPARLQALVARLHGRLGVVNPARVSRLPGGLGAAVIGLIRSGLDVRRSSEPWEAVCLHPQARERSSVPRTADARTSFELRMARQLVAALTPTTRDLLSGEVAWAALALYESAAPVVRLHRDRGAQSVGPPNAVGIAHVEYRLLIIGGHGRPSEWEAIDAAAAAAPAVTWPIQRRTWHRSVGEPTDLPSVDWFAVPLLVPDAWFCTHADPETLAEWARLTGRAGTADRYWFPDTWDRFLEPGRRVGWLTANDVWRPRRGRLPSASPLRADDDAWNARTAPAVRGAPAALTPDLQRGVGVPPGYALVECVGSLTTAVVVVRD